MLIRKLVIENYKSLKGRFTIEFNSGINILVGENEAGKSTILEALHLVLTGLLHGKYLKNELTQYIFNDEVINEYIENLEKGSLSIPPAILMEVFLIGDDLAILEGDANSDKKKDCGISLKIAFDEKFQDEYETLIKHGSIKTLPIEYYDCSWVTFARDSITPKGIPLKSALIDSSSNRYKNGSDVYISRIIKENLKETVDIS